MTMTTFGGAIYRKRFEVFRDGKIISVGINGVSGDYYSSHKISKKEARQLAEDIYKALGVKVKAKR